MATMDESAIEMHEAFLAFTKAGFTEDQALTLLIGMAGNNLKHKGTETPPNA